MPVLPTRKKAVVEPAQRRRTNVKTVTHGRLRWLKFDHLSDPDVRYLQRNFKFHALDYEDLLSTKQRPKIDEYDSYLFIILHVPFYDRATKRLIQEEVNVFIGQDYLIAVHSGRLKVINQLFDEVRTSPKLREQYMGKGSGFLLYELISRLFEHSFPMLDQIALRINAAEKEILAGNQKQMTEELSHLKLEIINFRRIIRPQRQLVENLEAKKMRFLPARLEMYFDDVLDAINRTNDLLENYKEVAESLEDTNETFIQHRTNNVVKVLTLISLATLPGAALSGLLAMNLKYPFPVNETTFFITVAVSVALALSLFAFMYLKRWL